MTIHLKNEKRPNDKQTLEKQKATKMTNNFINFNNTESALI